MTHSLAAKESERRPASASARVHPSRLPLDLEDFSLWCHNHPPFRPSQPRRRRSASTSPIWPSAAAPSPPCLPSTPRRHCATSRTTPLLLGFASAGLASELVQSAALLSSVNPNSSAAPELEIQRWWSQGDSNPRPLACHASALPAELWPRRRWYQRGAGGLSGVHRAGGEASLITDTRPSQFAPAAHGRAQSQQIQ